MGTQFKKGNSGKPKGAKNKVTTEVKEKFNLLLQSFTVEDMVEDLKAVKPLERLNIILGLAEYMIPKLARTQLQSQGNISLSVSALDKTVFSIKKRAPDIDENL